MPFDPKLIHADEPPVAANGDLNLPPDLAALGDQLRDDSNHLAALYPANIETLARSASEGPGPRDVQTRRTIALIASATAASLAALLAGLVVFWQSPVLNSRNHSAAPPTPSRLITTAPSHTTVSLTELSSPELEAMLDLLQYESSSRISVSF